MVFGFSLFGGGGSEEKELLNNVQTAIEEHKEDKGDAHLDVIAQAAKDLRAAADVEIARGARNIKVLQRVEQLSEGILSNLEARITLELLGEDGGPAIAARCQEIAKELDAVRATPASRIIEQRTDGLQEKLAEGVLKKVTDAYATMSKDPAKILEHGKSVLDAVEEAHAKAPTSKKVNKSLVDYCVQLSRELLRLLLPLLQANPLDAGGLKRIAERLDGIASKLVVVLHAENVWDPPAAPQVEEKVDETAKTIFTQSTAAMQAELDKGEMNPDCAGAIMGALVQLKPWWVIAADVDGCGTALQAVCEKADKALVEAFSQFAASGDKVACETLLGFAEEMDIATAAFDGIPIADSSLRSQMMDVGFSDVPAKLDALDELLAKETLEDATVVLVLQTMEGLVPMLGAASAADDTLVQRLTETLNKFEAKACETADSAPGAQALKLMTSAAKYDKFCTDLSLEGRGLQNTLAAKVANACLRTAEEEIAKTEGLNPITVVTMVEAFKAPLLQSTIVDDAFKPRLLAVLRATEDRMVEGFKASIAAVDKAKMQKQSDFAGRYDAVCVEVEPEIPESRFTLQQRLQLLAVTSAAEKQVASGTALDCATVCKAMGALISLCKPPRSAPEEFVTRIQTLHVNLKAALFSKTLKADEETMGAILECAKAVETALAIVEQREPSEEGGEFCQALTSTRDVNASLAVMDGELAKETGLNPLVVLKELKGLKDKWASVASNRDFGLRLEAVFAKLEDRMVASCHDACAAKDLAKVEKLLNFGSQCDEVREAADGDAKLREALAASVVRFHLDSAEDELKKEIGMHPKTVLDFLVPLPPFVARIGTESGAAEEIQGRFATVRGNLEERMNKAMRLAMLAEQARNMQALIKFASEYDSVFKECGLEGSLAEDLRAKAESGVDAAEEGAEEGNEVATMTATDVSAAREIGETPSLESAEEELAALTAAIDAKKAEIAEAAAANEFAKMAELAAEAEALTAKRPLCEERLSAALDKAIEAKKAEIAAAAAANEFSQMATLAAEAEALQAKKI